MIVYGHRGARGEAPENTIPGFRRLRDIGVQHTELDVRLSSDAKAVVIHDETLDRTTAATGPVAARSARELASLDARAAFPNWPDPCGVPTLRAVFDACPDIRGYQIEIKSTENDTLEIVCTRVLELIGEYDLAERVVVSSFSPIALERIKRMVPSQRTAYIGAYNRPAFVEVACRLQCSGACMNVETASADAIVVAHECGLEISGWTANTPAQTERLRTWPAHNIITDYPSRVSDFARSANPKISPGNV